MSRYKRMRRGRVTQVQGIASRGEDFFLMLFVVPRASTPLEQNTNYLSCVHLQHSTQSIDAGHLHQFHI